MPKILRSKIPCLNNWVAGELRRGAAYVGTAALRVFIATVLCSAGKIASQLCQDRLNFLCFHRLTCPSLFLATDTIIDALMK